MTLKRRKSLIWYFNTLNKNRMCEVSKTIKFCSCKDNLSEAHKHAKSMYYVWTLESVTGSSELAMDGLLMEEPTQLDELSAEKIVKELNSKNLFDFDYQPINDDTLEIKRVQPKKRYPKNRRNKTKLIGSHLSFYYWLDKWHIGYAGGFENIYKIYKSGKVEIIDKENKNH